MAKSTRSNSKAKPHLQLSDELRDRIRHLQGDEKPLEQIIEESLNLYFRANRPSGSQLSAKSYGPVTNQMRNFITPGSLTLGQIKGNLKESSTKPHFPPPIVRNKQEIILLSRTVIYALEDALDYDPLRHHNRPPPELRVEDDNYLQELRNLVAELKRLNDLLEGDKNTTKAKRTAVEFGKHFNVFLEKYSSSLAKPAAALTIVTVASLLHQAGVSYGGITELFSHLKSIIK